MNAPVRGEKLQLVPLELIDDSPLQHRETYSGLDELAASIRAEVKAGRRSLIHPVTLRPVGERYELVVGHRRKRGLLAAGETHAPAFVRAYSDEQVLEQQAVENLQREDVTALEEAKSYRQLQELGRTADEIAASIGKSRRLVYNRLKLCKLGPEGLAALQGGRINASVAQLLAGIDDPQRQKGALDKVLPYGDEPALSYRDAVDALEWHLKLPVLAEAPFRLDAELAPRPCDGCDQRETSEGADVCTDGVCYAGKLEQHAAKLEARAAELGRQVLAAAPKDHLRLDVEQYMLGGVRLEPPTTLAELLGEVGERRMVLVRDKKAAGAVTPWLPVGELVEALEEAGHKKLAAQIRREQQRRTREDAKAKAGKLAHAAQRDKEEKAEAQYRAAVVELVASIEAGEVPRAVWFLLAEDFADHSHEGAFVAAERRGIGCIERDAISKKLTAREAFAFLVEGVLIDMGSAIGGRVLAQLKKKPQRRKGAP